MVCILERVSRTHPRQQLRGTTEAQQTEQDEHLNHLNESVLHFNLTFVQFTNIKLAVKYQFTSHRVWK